jgi:hypothetical protein
MLSAACREHKQAKWEEAEKVVENSWKFYVDAKSHVGDKKQKKVSARRRGRESKRKKNFLKTVQQIVMFELTKRKSF